MDSIRYIADQLNNCAARKCGDCKYYLHSVFQNYSVCKNSLIEDMGKECKKVADQIGDDGK